MKKKFKTRKQWDWTKLTFSALKWQKNLARAGGKLDTTVTNIFLTPIDLNVLFDKVLLHEVSSLNSRQYPRFPFSNSHPTSQMTHTVAGGELKDVAGVRGYGK